MCDLDETLTVGEQEEILAEAGHPRNGKLHYERKQFKAVFQ